jgi:hypothetical protein
MRISPPSDIPTTSLAEDASFSITSATAGAMAAGL